MTIGILGGTFNPIHIGHLILAQEVASRLCFSKVLFIPSKIPPHKSTDVSEEDRYRMVELAIQGNPCFEISDIELKRQEISYTIHTVQTLQKEYQEAIVFIIGSDNISDLIHWYQWEKLLKICEFAIGKRPGFGIEIIEHLEPVLGKECCDRLKKNFVDMPGIDISSSVLRSRCKKRESLKYWIPEPVLQYILEHQLYTAKTGALHNFT